MIIVYVAEFGSTALALLHENDEPISIKLNDFSYSVAETLRTNLTSYLVSKGRMRAKLEDRGIRKVDHPIHRNVMHNVLKALWVRVVKPVLDALGYSVSCVSIQYLIFNVAKQKFSPHRIQVVFGGLQQVLWRLCPSMLQVYIAQKSQSLGRAFRTTLYPRTH